MSSGVVPMLKIIVRCATDRLQRSNSFIAQRASRDPELEPAKMRLPSVTLCCVDTRHPELGVKALSNSMNRVEFARSVLFTNLDVETADARIETIRIDALRSITDYSRFLMKGLWEHVRTEHVLVIQWDGFVIDQSAWTDEFLEFDYIGAPWSPLHAWLPPNHGGVGNGGFSLRSRRLLHALRDSRIRDDYASEDLAICIQYKSHLEGVHGIRFAPRPLAQRFSYEGDRVPFPTFGFHSFGNFPYVFFPPVLLEVLDALPDDLLLGAEATLLVDRLFTLARLDEAKSVLRKMLRVRIGDAATLQFASRLIDRNAACWCGSALKFSKCCGRLS
jgi:hypothetical protein